MALANDGGRLVPVLCNCNCKDKVHKGNRFPFELEVAAGLVSGQRIRAQYKDEWNYEWSAAAQLNIDNDGVYRNVSQMLP